MHSGARPRIGVLAVQGDIREHLAALRASGADPVSVRRPHELVGVAGVVLPGGESTTIDKLMRAFGLFDPLRAAIAAGLPAYGSCAGMILLAREVVDGTADQQSLGGLDITVRRNAFGRQVDSFEADLAMPVLVDPERPVRAVFIRAPWVEEVGPAVQVLARAPGASGVPGPVVAVRQGAVLATSFHPEVTGDERVHRYFVDLVRGEAGAVDGESGERVGTAAADGRGQ
ncbi:MAG: pyridoxal 5'-phosphate synthase glutaminase subunit PdxT [Austwickia sp.]|jgi:5'-phosphate synthase pdxT subunit|nr:pyridoxal 5'-phosphate synthase glutaminase subunit PdxT [Austwickia sp.]MBK8435217.1 pyridoxal 5'-phosphate synthase glutaminase subunit PdxT [Austwickia sp.]MBK9101230.1 pyridoxal 5'-phosphate synthase glutaminase subunit PdxT [Austwickia sp.]